MFLQYYNTHFLKRVCSFDQQEVEQLRKRLKQQDEESDAAQELQHLKSILQVLRVSLTTHRLRSRTLIKAINQRGYSAKKVSENRHYPRLVRNQAFPVIL